MLPSSIVVVDFGKHFTLFDLKNCRDLGLSAVFLIDNGFGWFIVCCTSSQALFCFYQHQRQGGKLSDRMRAVWQTSPKQCMDDLLGLGVLGKWCTGRVQHMVGPSEDSSQCPWQSLMWVCCWFQSSVIWMQLLFSLCIWSWQPWSILGLWLYYLGDCGYRVLVSILGCKIQACDFSRVFLISGFFTNLPLPQNFLEIWEVATKERKK